MIALGRLDVTRLVGMRDEVIHDRRREELAHLPLREEEAMVVEGDGVGPDLGQVGGDGVERDLGFLELSEGEWTRARHAGDLVEPPGQPLGERLTLAPRLPQAAHDAEAAMTEAAHQDARTPERRGEPAR